MLLNNKLGSQDFAIPVFHLYLGVMNPRLVINHEDEAKIQIKSDKSKLREENLLFL